MITLIRTATIAGGNQLAAAYGWAGKVSSFLHEHHQLDIKVLAPVGGNPHHIAWMVTLADLTDYERQSLAINSDPLYLELLMETKDLFVPNTIEDTIWRSKS